MGAFSQVWKSITGIPAQDFTGKRYTAVKFDAEGKVVTATAGSYPAGVIYEPNKIGEPAQVVASGSAYIVLGAELAAGTPVMADANGKAVAHTGATSPAVNHLLGVLQVGGAANDIGTVLLK